jgi:amino acid transporter
MSNETIAKTKDAQAGSYGLKHQVLSHLEVLGQSIANIAPTGTPTVVVPLVFAAALAGTWFAYLFALVGILLVSVSINQFAKRSASPGSIYNFIATGLGPVWGIVGGFALLIAYISCASSVTTGFTNYVNVLFKDVFHLQNGLPPLALVFIIFLSVLGSWFVAYKDVKLSTRLMLGLELVSLSFILLVVLATLIHNHFKLDLSQFNFKSFTPSQLRLGLVFAIFSFTGFESASSLGTEAKNPLRSIPRAIWQSALFVGVIFILTSYTEVLGFAGSAVTLDKSDAPLQVLASSAGIGFLGVLITIGAIISFFACVLASINAGARILFHLGLHGVLHNSISGTHETNETPHIAITITSILTFIPAAILAGFGKGMFDIYGWIGTTATLGFILAYILVAIAAPVYLFKRKELKIRYFLASLGGLVFMVIALVGAVYPLPDAPNSYPIYAFIVLLALGIIWGLFQYLTSSKVRKDIRDDLTAISDRHQVKEVKAN